MKQALQAGTASLRQEAWAQNGQLMTPWEMERDKSRSMYQPPDHQSVSVLKSSPHHLFFRLQIKAYIIQLYIWCSNNRPFCFCDLKIEPHKTAALIVAVLSTCIFPGIFIISCTLIAIGVFHFPIVISHTHLHTHTQSKQSVGREADW